MDSSGMLSEEFVYELVDISWSLDYDFGQEDCGPMVRDEGEVPEKESAPIEYDENGIPKGSTMEEIKIAKEKHPTKSEMLMILASEQRGLLLLFQVMLRR